MDLKNFYEEAELSPETRLDFEIMSGLLNELKAFEQQTPPHPAVQTALTIVHRAIMYDKDSLLESRVLITVHGSMQYNDPKNLDADVDFICYDNPLLDYVERVVNDIDEHIDKSIDWPTHTPVTNSNTGVHDVKKDLDALIKLLPDKLDELRIEYEMDTDMSKDYSYEQMKELLDKLDDRGFYTSMGIAEIFSAKLLYPEQAELQREMQLKVLEVFAKNTFLRRATMCTLQDVINTRKRRRGLLS